MKSEDIQFARLTVFATWEVILKKYIFRNGVSLHSLKYCWKRNFNQFCEVLTLHFKASRGVNLLGTFHREHFFFRAKATQAVV